MSHAITVPDPGATITEAIVEKVRRRADVPRVRSSEVRKIIVAYAEILADAHDNRAA